MMGLPIGKLVVATNENDVLDEFFKTGNYQPRSPKDTFQTSSPSMDISKASNFERFIFDVLGRDAASLRDYWKKIENGGSFQLDKNKIDAMKIFGFISSSSKHENRIKLIKKFHDEYDVIIDTHTADGVKASLDHLSKDTPMLVLETALPTKFEKTVLEAIGKKPNRPDELVNLEKIDQRFEVFDNKTSLVKDFILAKK